MEYVPYTEYVPYMEYVFYINKKFGTKCSKNICKF